MGVYISNRFIIKAAALSCFIIFLFPQSCELRRFTNGHDDFDTEYESSASKVLGNKYADLLELSSRESLIKINSRQFARYVADVPRNYTTILLLTDDRGRASSKDCRLARSSLDVIANSYYYSLNGSSPKLFFVEVCSHRSPELLSQIGVSRADIPSVFQVPPKGMLTNLVEMDSSAYTWELQSLRDWVIETTGIQINIKPFTAPSPPAAEKQSTVSLIMMLGTIGAYLFYKRDVLMYVISMIFQEPGSVGIFVVSFIILFLSGIMYCQMENVPLFHRSPHSGEIFLIYPSTNSQFLAELVIVYSLYGMIAYGMIQLIEYPQRIKEKKEGEPPQSKPSSFFLVSPFIMPFLLVLVLAKYKMTGDG